MKAAESKKTSGPVLVVQFARFGDVVQSKRLVKTLLERGCETHLLVDESLVELAGLIYPEAAVHGATAHRTGGSEAEVPAASAGVFAELRGIGFERVYNLNFSGLNFALAAMFDPEIVSGYRVVRGTRVKDAWCGMVTRWAAGRKAYGLNLVDYWANFDFDPVEPGTVNPIARPAGGGVGVVVAGRHVRRSLPPEVLAPVVAAAAKGVDARSITVLGGKGDRSAAREFIGRLSSGAAGMARDMTGRTSYADLLEIVSGLDTLITPDTGTMHLAAHVGAPVQAMFLSSAWCFETGPYGLGHKVWQAEADCAPCLESAECVEGVKCLKAFSDRNFLRYLMGSQDFEYPRGLLGLVSAMDGLGCVYRPVLGDDPAAGRRAKFRALAAEFLGEAKARPEDADLAPELFLERDWMLMNERYHYNYLEYI
jgi:ADP-heptose:LPS heptosyltransferase